MGKVFQVLCFDPPFSFSDKLNHSDVKRGAEANYSTMSMDDLKALPVKEITDPNGAVLCLWVPSTLLQDGLDIMKAWGFSFKQIYVWTKIKKEPIGSFRKSFDKLAKDFLAGKKNDIKLSDIKGLFTKASDSFAVKDTLSMYLGRLFRQSHEICLIGTSNNKIYKKLANKSQRSVCFAYNNKHSEKPEDLQDSLDLMFNGCQKFEGFARRERAGWTTVGNQCPGISFGEDIRVSLDKLISGE